MGCLMNDRMLDEATRRLLEIEGKGTWPEPDYVRDMNWDRWHGARDELARLIAWELDRRNGTQQ